MNLKRIRRRLQTLRNKTANIRSTQLVNLAKALGRKKSERGKEPTYISGVLPARSPISIPNHPGSLSKFTAENILDQIEEDLMKLEEIEEKEKEKK